jgi:hypothetical protein
MVEANIAFLATVPKPRNQSMKGLRRRYEGWVFSFLILENLSKAQKQGQLITISLFLLRIPESSVLEIVADDEFKQ